MCLIFPLIYDCTALVTHNTYQSVSSARAGMLPDLNVENHDFVTPEEMYRQNFSAIFDHVIVSLRESFGTHNAKFFRCLKAFSIREEENSKSIVELYKNYFSEESLVSDRDVFLCIFSSKIGQSNEKFKRSIFLARK